MSQSNKNSINRRKERAGSNFNSTSRRIARGKGFDPFLLYLDPAMAIELDTLSKMQQHKKGDF